MNFPSPPDQDLVEWNNRMYGAHPTPYAHGLAGYIQNQRVQAVYRLAQAKPGEKILELGCESGRLLLQSSPQNPVTGVDISTKALEDAANLFHLHGRTAEWHQLDASQPLPFAAGSFDVIICSEMLEHVHQPALILEQISRICTTQTRIIVTVPIEAPKLVIKSMLARMGLLHFFFPNIEEGQSEWHLQAFSRPMLVKLASQRFEILEIKNVWGCHLVASLKLKDRN